MGNAEIADAFARMWKKSREDAGKSQDYMAKALGVSKKTVQNWEDGLSCPNQKVGFEWFYVLGLQPLPYYLELLYPNEFEDISSKDDDKRIEDALIAYIKGTTPDQRRKLLYIMFGDHGSSPRGVIEMVTAHLHCDLRYRLNIAQSIINNYEVAEAQGHLVGTDHIMPDMDTLQKSFNNAKRAVKNRESQYTNV